MNAKTTLRLVLIGVGLSLLITGYALFVASPADQPDQSAEQTTEEPKPVVAHEPNETLLASLGVGLVSIGHPDDARRPVPVSLDPVTGNFTYLVPLSEGKVGWFPTPLSDHEFLFYEADYDPNVEGAIAYAGNISAELYDSALKSRTLVSDEVVVGRQAPAVSPDRKHFAYQSLSDIATENRVKEVYLDASDWEINLDDLDPRTSSSQILLEGLSPVWISDSEFLFLSTAGLYVYDLNKAERGYPTSFVFDFGHYLNATAAIAFDRATNRLAFLDETGNTLRIFQLNRGGSSAPQPFTVTELTSEALPVRSNLWPGFTQNPSVLSFTSRAFGSDETELWAYDMKTDKYYLLLELPADNRYLKSQVTWVAGE